MLFTEPVKFKIINEQGKICKKSFMIDELKLTSFDVLPKLTISAKQKVFKKNTKNYKVSFKKYGEKSFIISAYILKLLNLH